MRIRARMPVVVERVIDGDTILGVVRCAACGGYVQARMRLAGVDAPELDREPDAARRAKEYLEILLRKAASVEGVVSRSGPDLYGRWIVDLYVDGVSVAELMIAAGHGVPYAQRRRRTGPFSKEVARRLALKQV